MSGPAVHPRGPAAARILLVTSGPLWRNPRVHKEALALGNAGYDVTALAPAYRDDHEALDAPLLAGAPFRKLTIDLRPGGNAARPWARVKALAARASTRLARTLARGGLETVEALGPAADLARRARELPADLTILHTEVAFAAGPSLLEAGRRVAADFEDWHSRDLLPDARRSRPIRLIEALERRLQRGACYTSTTSECLANALQAAFGGARPVVLRNVFPLDPPPPSRPPSSVPAFLWFSQTLGPGRNLERMVDAWGATHGPSRLCLLGASTPGFRDALRARLPESRRSRLEFLDVVPPRELPALIARHEVGLALEPSEPESRNLTITNKFFQYLNAGLPVLATATAGQREALASAPGAGRLIDLADSAAGAAVLDEMVRDTPLRVGMAAAARRAAERDLCWERESGRLLAAVERCLAAAPAPP